MPFNLAGQEGTNMKKKIVSSSLSLVFADSSSLMDTAHSIRLPHTESHETFAAGT